MAELPSTPWQAPQTTAFSLPAAASCAMAQTGSKARRASNARSFFISFTLFPALSRQGGGLFQHPLPIPQPSRQREIMSQVLGSLSPRGRGLGGWGEGGY